ncbi:hypothetical protein MSPP1_000234 [Malassezia sp. CBS 17886]|nr:hypothetical protein MSPP1_000234 [Malassezia sp. CBS 17886]
MGRDEQWERAADGTQVAPACRPEHIDKLISDVDRYNPQNAEVLVDYLGTQMENGTYDALTNLALLKLYQLNQGEFNFDAVINVLLKALTAVPFPDFGLCISLLGEAPLQTLKSAGAAELPSVDAAGIIVEPIIVRIATLSTFLFETKFRAFWEHYRSNEYADVRQYAAAIADFEPAVRQIALNSVKGTFRTISQERLAGYLGLPVADLGAYLAGHPGWTLADGKVAVPPNPDNQVKATVVREEISLENLSKLLSQA